jgi:hypothetical protein
MTATAIARIAKARLAPHARRCRGIDGYHTKLHVAIVAIDLSVLRNSIRADF